MSLDGDPTSVRIEEIGALEKGLKTTYNGLTEQTCDDQFRRLSSSSFVLDGARRILAAKNDRVLSQITANYKIDVNGTSR